LAGMPLIGGRHFAIGDINKDGSVDVLTSTANGALSATPLPLQPQ